MLSNELMFTCTERVRRFMSSWLEQGVLNFQIHVMSQTKIMENVKVCHDAICQANTDRL